LVGIGVGYFILGYRGGLCGFLTSTAAAAAVKSAKANDLGLDPGCS
jgi:hypothetical protein